MAVMLACVLMWLVHQVVTRAICLSFQIGQMKLLFYYFPHTSTTGHHLGYELDYNAHTAFGHVMSSCLRSIKGCCSQLLFYENNNSFHFSHCSSTSDQKTSSPKDVIRGTEVAPPASSGYKQAANSSSWLSNITSSTFRNKQPKSLEGTNGENNLITKYK